jgi:hypothetical protein
MEVVEICGKLSFFIDGEDLLTLWLNDEDALHGSIATMGRGRECPLPPRQFVISVPHHSVLNASTNRTEPSPEGKMLLQWQIPRREEKAKTDQCSIRVSLFAYSIKLLANTESENCGTLSKAVKSQLTRKKLILA